MKIALIPFLILLLSGRVNQECLAAKDQDSFKTLNQISNRRDGEALTAGIMAGRFFVVAKDTKVTRLDGGLGWMKVKVESGKLTGRSVILSKEFVTF